jgi:hypothetical protein
MYGPTIFNLSHLFDLFCRKRVPTNTQKVADGGTLPRYCVISVMRRVLVWRHGRDVHGGLCNENAEKWTECVCVKMETWWDGKEVTNELHLQLHLPHRLEETVGYVWSENVWPFSNFLTFFLRSECGIMGTKSTPAEDSSATALYPCFLRVLAGPYGNYVVSDDTCPVIRDSVISVILAGVSVT